MGTHSKLASSNTATCYQHHLEEVCSVYYMLYSLFETEPCGNITLLLTPVHGVKCGNGVLASSLTSRILIRIVTYVRQYSHCTSEKSLWGM